MSDTIKIGQWIKIERHTRGISQSKLAKLLQLNQAVLSEWETEKKNPPEVKLEEIKALFNSYDSLNEEERSKFFQRRKYLQTRYDVGLANATSNRVKKKPQQLTFRDKLSSYKRVENGMPKGIALFAGCGGLSQGFHNAGVDVVGYAELIPNFCNTYDANFPGTPLLGHDVRDISNDDVKIWKKVYGEIDVLFGGPPCQGFSLAGKRDVYDPRNQLYNEFARIASVLKPKAIVLENVKLLTTMKTIDGGYVKDDIVKKFEIAGYTMDYKVLNAKDYGVPQSRERVIFIGIRNDVLGSKKITFPSPTHGNQKELHPYKTFRDATGDLESLESGESSKSDPLHFAITHPKHVIEMLKVTPEGKSAHENEDPKLRPKSGFNTTYKRLEWDAPCSTISTNFSMISGSRNVHPTNTRSLTIREATRCQTFPDDFKFVGTLGVIRTMIGNAVPPKLGEVVANHVLKEYLEPKLEIGVYRNNLLQG